MEDLITSIVNTLSDYRKDEKRAAVRITKENVNIWINQFDEQLKIPILIELDNIFKKRYCSKSGIKGFLEGLVDVLTKDFKFSSPVELLKNSDFLSLQSGGKSQGTMLSLLDEFISQQYGIGLEDCGSVSKKYSIYIDDILCTGLTLISDIEKWSKENFTSEKTNNAAVADGSTKLVFAYVFIHEKNYHKKVVEMRHKISNEISSKHTIYRLKEIENGTGPKSKIDIILPVDADQIESVNNYKNKIIKEVDIHTAKYNSKSKEEFYREQGLPRTEGFFTSKENRKIVEDAFLKKGIEILNNSNVNNKNMRALGYSLPSLKNFGFGALCFTWRNVPNNAPLVFWYSGGGFIPLFKVKRGGNSIVNFKFEGDSSLDIEDLF